MPSGAQLANRGIIWSRTDGQPLPFRRHAIRTAQSRSSLQIIMLRTSDTAAYQCTVETTAGSGADVGSLRVGKLVVINFV